MDPVFRAAGSPVYAPNTVVDPTALSPIKDASTAAGDLMICWTWCRSRTATVATPAGWNLLNGFPKASATTSGGKLYCFWRVSAGSDNPAISWSGVTTGTAGDTSGAVMISYVNVGNPAVLGDPSDATVAFSDLAAQTTTSVIPAVTTGTDRSIVLGFAMKLNEAAGQTSTVATFTERVDSSTTNGTGHAMEASEKFQASAGSSGTATVTWSDTTSARAITCSIALKARVILANPAAGQSSARLDLVAGDYSTAVLANTPLAYYRMGHNAVDFSGNRHDGVQHAVTFAAVAGAVDSDDGAARFDGSTSYMDGFGFNPWSGALTVEAWVKTDAYAGGGTICVVGSDGTNPNFAITGGGNVTFLYNGILAAVWANAWATIGDDRYAHLVMTFDPASLANTHLYVNGEDRGNPGSVGAFGATGNLMIGARAASPVAFFDGVIDEVAIYSGLLTANAIATHYRAGVQRRNPLYAAIRDVSGLYLAAHYRMGEADPTLNAIYDSNVFARHAAITGGLGTVDRKAAGGSLDSVDPYSTSFDGATDYATADVLSPFVAGSQRTFVMLFKRDSISAAITNILCGEGLWNPGVSDDMKLPVLEFSTDNPYPTIRWYGSVDRDFPIFQDWRISISDTNWHLYILRVDDSQPLLVDALDLAIDGVPMGPPTLTVLGGRPTAYNGFEATAGKFMWGVRHNTLGDTQANEYADFTYDDIAVINKWISDADVRTLANAMGLFPVPLADAIAVSSASLTGLTTPKILALSAANGLSSASLALTVARQVLLNPASAVSSASLALHTPTQVPLDPASATSSASLALTAPTVVAPANLTLAPAVSQSSASMTLHIGVYASLPRRPCVAAFHREGPLPNVAAHFLATSRLNKMTNVAAHPQVIYLPGGGGLETSWQGGTGTNPSEVGDVFRDCVDRGIFRRRAVTFPTDWTWGDSEMKTRMDSMLTFAEANYGFSPPYHLVAVSMGTTCALNWAKDNLAKVKSLALMLPAVDLQDINDNRAPAYPAVVPPSTPYGTSSIPAAYNPITYAAVFNGVTPTKCWYSTNDSICNVGRTTAFGSAAGAIMQSIGNQSGGFITGHGLDSGFTVADVHTFLINHDT